MPRPGTYEGINYDVLPPKADNNEYHRLYKQQYRKAENNKYTSYNKEYYQKNKERLNAQRAEIYRKQRDFQKGLIIKSC